MKVKDIYAYLKKKNEEQSLYPKKKKKKIDSFTELYIKSGAKCMKDQL